MIIRQQRRDIHGAGCGDDMRDGGEQAVVEGRLEIDDGIHAVVT